VTTSDHIDAAGIFVDHNTLLSAQEKHIYAFKFLSLFDSDHFFQQDGEISLRVYILG
jgi:hypothetical protein